MSQPSSKKRKLSEMYSAHILDEDQLEIQAQKRLRIEAEVQDYVVRHVAAEADEPAPIAREKRLKARQHSFRFIRQSIELRYGEYGTSD
jgi:hypothetical protein